MIPEIEQHRTKLHDLCRYYGVHKLELFGSASTGNVRPDSDLDFLVEFEPQPNYADRYFGLLESLEQLFNRHVDLVVASAIKNPYLQESVDKTKAPLYSAGSRQI